MFMRTDVPLVRLLEVFDYRTLGYGFLHVILFTIVSLLGINPARLYFLHYSDVTTATARITAISEGSRVDADMSINTTKTEAVQFAEQGRVPVATDVEITAKCNHK